jgi:hypothetical protein
VFAGEHRLEVALRLETEVGLEDGDGALKPEFDVASVNAILWPLRSVGSLIGLSAGTMISIS